ncbi:MAG: hypothetical protein QOG68_812, partial [Solirubrobacteraceae bacterium]|nr:hypothetical protein [Solirubrobacteraceae bacterium]
MLPAHVTPDKAETIGRSTAFALLAEVVRTGAAAVLTLYLVRALHPHGYGLYAVAIGFGVIAVMVSDFGVAGSTSRFVAEKLADRKLTAALISDGLRVKLVISGTASIALIALASPIAGAYGQPDLVGPLRAVAAVTLGQSLFQFFVGVVLGMGRNALQARLYAIEGIGETVFAITIVALGGGAAGALMGQAAGYAVASAVGLAIVAKRLGRGVLPRIKSGGHSQRIATYASALVVINAAYTLFEQIDVILVTAYLTPADAAYFQAPTRLAVVVAIAGAAMSNAIAPRVARHAREPENVVALIAALRVLAVLGLAGAALVMVWSGPIV